jgi:hypothetical protein
MEALEELTRFSRTCRHILLGTPANPEDQDRDWRSARPSSLTEPDFPNWRVVRDEAFEIAGAKSCRPQ